MTAKTFGEWRRSVSGSFTKEEWELAIWTASRAALLTNRPDVAGLAERIGNVVFADEHCTDDMLKRETIAAIESLAAQLAETRQMHAAMCKEVESSAALVFQQAAQLAQRDEEIAKLKAQLAGNVPSADPYGY